MSEESSSGSLIAAVLLGVATFGIFVVELLIPTGGLLAILCVATALASIVLGFMYDPTAGMVLLAIYAVAAPFMLMIGLRVAAKSPIGRRLVLSAEIPARTGAEPAPVQSLPAVGDCGRGHHAASPRRLRAHQRPPHGCDRGRRSDRRGHACGGRLHP